LLRTTYAAGLRVSEVVRLRVSDLDSERMLIRVEQGKGMKDRYTLLSPQLLEELRLYWRLYRPPLWLFPSTDPQRQLHIGRAQKVYYQAKARAGITKGGGIHTLRHCFATHLLEAGVDLRTIQSLMGHTSITTTMRYLQVRRQPLDSRQQLMDLLASPESGVPGFVGDHCHAARAATTGGSDRLTAAAEV
jgi:site-specific recombinase XerD